MVDVHEYDLWLAPDTNVTNVARVHTQWFFFRVRGMRTGVRYRFNIQNLEKPKSLYSTGMQPLVYSEAAAAPPRRARLAPRWRRHRLPQGRAAAVPRVATKAGFQGGPDTAGGCCGSRPRVSTSGSGENGGERGWGGAGRGPGRR